MTSSAAATRATSRSGASSPASPAGPILDLGCGTGRVALDLARHGHRVRRPRPRPGAGRRASTRARRPRGCRPRRSSATRRDFDLDEEFALVLAPMQLIQVLGGAGRAPRLPALRRRATCARAAASRSRSSTASRRLTDEGPPPLPDAREVDGWVYSSLPLDAALDGGSIVVRRLRQTVSPDGRAERRARRDPLCACSRPRRSRTRRARPGSSPPAAARSRPPTPTSAPPSSCWRRR